MEKDHQHYSETFLLDSRTKIDLETPGKSRKRLKQILKKISNISHCPNCGGLTPEINFEDEGVRYFFTCHRIEKEGKVIAETDYAKLGDYYKNLR